MYVLMCVMTLPPPPLLAFKVLAFKVQRPHLIMPPFPNHAGCVTCMHASVCVCVLVCACVGVCVCHYYQQRVSSSSHTTPHHYITLAPSLGCADCVITSSSVCPLPLTLPGALRHYYYVASLYRTSPLP